MESIWVVEAAVYEKNDWDEPVLHHYEVVTDYGWFTTKEAAQKACDVHTNAYRVQYDHRVECVNQRNKTIAANNERVLRQWKAKVAASDKPVSPPWLETPTRMETFENWVDRRYAPIEIKAA